MFQDLKIFQKTYDFMLWIYPRINAFPKSQRFVLGQQMQNSVIDILKGIIQANTERNKLPYLKQVSTDLDKLRILVRLSKDLHFINIRKYECACSYVNEIGRMLGGWIKSAN